MPICQVSLLFGGGERRRGREGVVKRYDSSCPAARAQLLGEFGKEGMKRPNSAAQQNWRTCSTAPTSTSVTKAKQGAILVSFLGLLHIPLSLIYLVGTVLHAAITHLYSRSVMLGQ